MDVIIWNETSNIWLIIWEAAKFPVFLAETLSSPQFQRLLNIWIVETFLEKKYVVFVPKFYQYNDEIARIYEFKF